MAAPRTGDGAVQGQKRSHFSRRSASSSPGRSSPVQAASRSPSPRTKRLRRAQEERELERNRERDHGRSHDRDRDRDRGSNRGRIRNRDREDDDRMVSREKDRGRDRTRGNSREQERPRDRRGRDRGRDSSPVRSPVRSRHERSLSPKESRQRRLPSPRTSPHQQRNSKNEQHMNTGTMTAARDEADGDAGKGRDRDNESTTPKQDDALSRMKEIEASLEKGAKEKEKPSFEYSGKLAAETNKVKGVTLQFTEPPEARKPSTRWRLYVFKDGEPLNDPLYIHRQTCYLFGRERRVADIPTDHPSCSKQHAVIQYRLTEKEEASGSTSNKVRPYVMDLGSTNGTFLNGERLDPQRYYEMFEKDTVKFGNSSREYVLLHEHSAG